MSEPFIAKSWNKIKSYDSLLMSVDNNMCEQFNSVINKRLAGKRIYHTTQVENFFG